MTRSGFIPVALMAALLLAAWCPCTSAQTEDRVAGEVIALLDSDASAAAVCRLLHDGNDSVQIQCLSPRLNIWLFRWNADEQLLLQRLRHLPQVRAAQFNRRVSIRTTPDDPLFTQQWALHNVGQTGGTSGADVRATSAWDITTGGLTPAGDTIVIAIVDDGFDLNHSDLNFRKNYHEIPLNGLDDDNNGYVDDYDGWNSISNNGNIPAMNHGTEMTGVAAARTDNSLGIAGMNWNVQVLPVRGVGTEAQVVAAYNYVLEQRIRYNQTAGQQGACVVVCNSSFGINNGKPENFPLWCAMYDTMGAYGILSVGSTTNSKVNVDIAGDIPTTCPSPFLITVTNTNASDQLEAGYGPESIDLAAPGSGILTTYTGNSYGLANGTSPSAAHVTGAVALLYALNCYGLADDLKANPAATALKIKDWILQGADTLLQLADKTVTGGRLNAHTSLLLAIAHYNCQVGLNDAPAAHELQLFPNPGQQQFWLALPPDCTGDAVVVVHNLLGQVLLHQPISGAGPWRIAAAHFPDGVYRIAVHAATAWYGATWLKQ